MTALSQTYCWVPAVALLAFSALVAAPASPAAETAYVVIVHPDNPAKSVTKSELSQLLLKSRPRWEHGPAVEPVDLDSKSHVRQAFSKDIHGRSASSIKNYWQRIFSGHGVPPPELASESQVVAFVKSHPGAIGYVSAEARLNGVKILDLASE